MQACQRFPPFAETIMEAEGKFIESFYNKIIENVSQFFSFMQEMFQRQLWISIKKTKLHK